MKKVLSIIPGQPHNGKVYSSGGRVLNITSVGKNFIDIRNNIFKILKHINWKHGFWRKDIGWRVIKNENHYGNLKGDH